MPLSLKQIEDTINFMDSTYDANFGNWIRNEDNCKIVAGNLKKYIECYRESEFITVLKWIVKEWTLRSIIVLTKKLFIEDLGAVTPEDYTRRIRILSGLVFTWSPLFISEFLLANTVEMRPIPRTDFMAGVLNVFDSAKLGDILGQIKGKMNVETQTELVKKLRRSVYLPTRDEWKRRSSMLEAYNITGR